METTEKTLTSDITNEALVLERKLEASDEIEYGRAHFLSGYEKNYQNSKLCLNYNKGLYVCGCGNTLCGVIYNTLIAELTDLNKGNFKIEIRVKWHDHVNNREEVVKINREMKEFSPRHWGEATLFIADTLNEWLPTIIDPETAINFYRERMILSLSDKKAYFRFTVFNFFKLQPSQKIEIFIKEL